MIFAKTVARKTSHNSWKWLARNGERPTWPPVIQSNTEYKPQQPSVKYDQFKYFVDDVCSISRYVDCWKISVVLWALESLKFIANDTIRYRSCMISYLISISHSKHERILYHLCIICYLNNASPQLRIFHTHPLFMGVGISLQPIWENWRYVYV